LAARVAHVLRGKHKPQYAPHADCGDHVIITDAEKIVLTGNKMTDKIYYSHSGYPGHLKEANAAMMLAKHPEKVIIKAVRGMLPHNRLGRAMARKLKVIIGPDHSHQAQQPKPLEL
jgi:large subunit ribosomal protein L13